MITALITLAVLVGIALLADSLYFALNYKVVASRVNARYPKVPCRLVAATEMIVGAVLCGVWLL